MFILDIHCMYSFLFIVDFMKNYIDNETNIDPITAFNGSFRTDGTEMKNFDFLEINANNRHKKKYQDGTIRINANNLTKKQRTKNKSYKTKVVWSSIRA